MCSIKLFYHNRHLQKISAETRQGRTSTQHAQKQRNRHRKRTKRKLEQPPQRKQEYTYSYHTHTHSLQLLRVRKRHHTQHPQQTQTYHHLQPHSKIYMLHLHTPSLFRSLLFLSSFTLCQRTRTEHANQLKELFTTQLSGSLSTPEADTWLHITLTSLEEKASQLLRPLSPFTQNRSPIVRSENNSTAKVCSPKKHSREQHTHTDTLKLISSSSSAVSSIPFQLGISSHLPLILFLDVICMLLPSVEENMCLLSRDLP